MMYWRIRRYSAAEMFQRYGVHVGLSISLIVNVLLLVTRPSTNHNLAPTIKVDFDQFARKVTEHILDTSYINYQTATNSLMDPQSGELAPPVVQALRKRGLLPNSREEFEASLKSFTDAKRVCAINIQNVRVDDPDASGVIPVDVTGVVAVHSAEESYPGPVPFRFQYKIGYRKGGTQPLVSNFADLSH